MFEKKADWLAGNGPDSDIAVNSWASLSRNLADFLFPARCAEEDKRVVEQRVLDAIQGAGPFSRDRYCSLPDAPEIEIRCLVERELVAPQLLEGKGARGVLVTEDQNASLTVNGQDHLQILALASGANPESAWARANAVDEVLAGRLDYAYHEQCGYLTASLALAGTGLKAGVTLHLPGLTMNNAILSIEREVRQNGHVIEGVFGPISDAKGHLYRLSNAATLGKPEEEIVFHLRQAAAGIIEREHAVRDKLLSAARVGLDDRIGRALGIARGARLLDLDEAFSLLSFIRLGVAAGLLEGYDVAFVNEMMVISRDAHLELKLGHACDDLTRTMERADLFRARFS